MYMYTSSCFSSSSLHQKETLRHRTDQRYKQQETLYRREPISHQSRYRTENPTPDVVAASEVEREAIPSDLPSTITKSNSLQDLRLKQGLVAGTKTAFMPKGENGMDDDPEVRS